VDTRCGRYLTTGTAAAALLVVFSSAAWAQQPAPPPDTPSELSNLSLEQLAELEIDSVYGASRYSQKVTEAPSSITIIGAEEIQRYGYRTLADILRSVRGFYVTYDRNYSYLGVRGFSRPGDYNARVLLLVDGHRLNDNIFGAALIGTEFPMDVDLIERVEIIRGPSSSLYGTSAFFAVINVISRRGGTLRGLEAAGAFASFDTRKGRLTYGRKFDAGPEVLLSASSYDSQGERQLFFREFDSPATNNGIAENADADRFAKFFGRVTFKNVTLLGVYGAREKAIPTASFGTVFNDPRSQTIERQGFVDLQYERTFANTWDVATRVHVDRYSYDGDYVYDHSETDTPLLVVNKDFARGNWWGTELKLTKRFRQGHTVAAGTEYRNNFRQDQFNYDEEPFQQHLDARQTSSNWALYVQDEVALHRTLLLNVGLRHDHYDTFGGTTNPRAGLIYSPFTKTALKLLYGQAFRAPNAYELFWQQEGLAKSNRALRPETNRTTEVVLEQYLGTHLRIAATGFHYGIKGLITQQTDPVDNLLVYNNVEQIRAKGVELEVEGRWASGLRARLGHTFEDSRNDETGLGLTNSPKHLSKVNLITPVLAEKLSAGVELQYISARRTIAGGEVPGVLIPNLTVFGHGLPKQLEISASLYNLFDRTYADPGSEEHRQETILQSGRSFRVKLAFRLP
jgi:outer membrane receptor for ferrienterochelin and colicins